ncbi:MAG: Hpt domain-containing protein [Planctomycetes bacterium]|nr:Hpt domain-containing protein [Planctomycetota bacterium]
MESPATRSVTMNTEIALRRLNGKVKLLTAMANLFLEDAPQLHEQLHQAVRARSSAQIVRHAHSLRGLAAPFEATRFMQLAEEIEQHGSDGVSSGLLRLVDEFDAELLRLTDAVKTLCK